MKNANRMRLAALIAGALALLASCSDSAGIFSDIQAQTKQSGSELFRKNAITGFYKLGTTYYASGVKLYSRAVADEGRNWEVAPIGGSKDYELKAAAQGGGGLYASVLDSSGSNILYFTSDGSSWSAVTTPVTSGSWIDGLFAAGSYVFAQLHTDVANDENDTLDTYTLYYSSSGSALTAVSISIGSNKHLHSFAGVAYDKTYYWYATRGSSAATVSGRLFHDDGLPSGTITEVTSAALKSPVADSAVITSIASDPNAAAGSGLYVGSFAGKLYHLASGTWDSASVGSGGPIAALGFAGSSKMLVGEGFDDNNSSTDGGYYEGSWGSFASGYQDGSSYVTSSKSVYATTVSGKAINAFYFDDADSSGAPSLGDTLFVALCPGTSSSTYYGLYRSAYTAAAWEEGWAAE